MIISFSSTVLRTTLSTLFYHRSKVIGNIIGLDLYIKLSFIRNNHTNILLINASFKVPRPLISAGLDARNLLLKNHFVCLCCQSYEVIGGLVVERNWWVMEG